MRGEEGWRTEIGEKRRKKREGGEEQKTGREEEERMSRKGEIERKPREVQRTRGKRESRK